MSSFHPLPLHPAVSARSIPLPCKQKIGAPEQFSAPPAVSSRAVPPSGGSRRTLSASGCTSGLDSLPESATASCTPEDSAPPKRSKRISPAVCPLKSTTMLIRRLRWGTPQYWASCVLHATLHPSPSIPPAFVHFCLSGSRGRENPGSAMRTASSSTAPKSPNPSLKLLLNAPGTFSQTIYRGRTSSPVRPMLLSCSLISLTIHICFMYKPERAPARPARFPAMLKSWQGLPPVMHQTGVISAPLIFVISPKCLMKIASLSECHQHYRVLSSGML